MLNEEHVLNIVFILFVPGDFLLSVSIAELTTTSTPLELTTQQPEHTTQPTDPCVYHNVVCQNLGVCHNLAQGWNCACYSRPYSGLYCERGEYKLI